MPTYSVIVAGTGIKVPAFPDPMIGFVTTRRVKASDAEEAAQKAKAIIQREWEATEYKQTNIGSSPKIQIEEINELGLWAQLFSRAPTKGYTFYSQE